MIRSGLLATVAWASGAQTTTQSNSGAPAAAVLSVLPAPVGVVANRVAFAGDFGGSFTSANPVAGHPYSAQQETETVQTLADGTHITNGVQKVTLYRDSQGRTRTERTAQQPPGILSTSTSTPPVFIDISDPVGGYRYTFDLTSHRAYRASVAPMRVPKPAIIPPPATGAVPAQRGVVLAGGFAPSMARVDGANQQVRPEISTEQLGTQTIEGVLAEGVRTTMTYPIGFFGNDRPLTTFNETWTSRELGMPVLTKMSDPRSGVTTMKLMNISQAEPAASLFQPPAGYEIVGPEGEAQRK